METTLIEATSETQLAVSLDPPPLCVPVRRERNGPVVARERVTKADLADVLSEAWRDACLRKGHPDVPLSSVPMRLLLNLSSPTSDRCVSYALELSLPDGQRVVREFTLKSLHSVAMRGVQRFIDADRLQAQPSLFYELVHDRARAAAPALNAPGPVFDAAVKTPPLTFQRVALRPLLRAATAVHEIDEESFAVFFTKEAFAKAERFARKGAQRQPPVETGAVLIGTLCACPETGEFFCVVTDALEVLEAEETEFSLSYSGKSWLRIQTMMKARLAANPGCSDRVLGQCHGHNYRPGTMCEACPKLPVCNLNNVFASQDDQSWSKAVFARQPWSLCGIFGLTARGDRVNGLFTLKDGRLQSRGFYLLSEFTPEQCKADGDLNERA